MTDAPTLDAATLLCGITPGPWVAQDSGDGTQHIAVGAWPYGSVVCSEVLQENAALIAAAPALAARVVGLEAVLRVMVYETTHLSPERDDGSHSCRISKDALDQARAALASPGPVTGEG